MTETSNKSGSKWLYVIGIALLIVAGVLAVIYLPPLLTTRASTTCVAGPNEQCPGDDFVKGYTEAKHEKDALFTDSFWRKYDQWNGLSTRLNSMIPQPACGQITSNCWKYDEGRARFVHVAAATPTPPVTTSPTPPTTGATAPPQHP